MTCSCASLVAQRLVRAEGLPRLGRMFGDYSGSRDMGNSPESCRGRFDILVSRSIPHVALNARCVIGLGRSGSRLQSRALSRAAHRSTQRDARTAITICNFSTPFDRCVRCSDCVLRAEAQSSRASATAHGTSGHERARSVATTGEESALQLDLGPRWPPIGLRTNDITSVVE